MEVMQLKQILDLAIDLIALLFPALGIYAVLAKKAKNELLRVLDNSPVNNKALYQLAQNMGQTRAAKAIEGLEL